eukprot:SAG11_NODE_10947_length_794_cov_1.030216_1_plen_39_part_10
MIRLSRTVVWLRTSANDGDATAPWIQLLLLDDVCHHILA